MIGRLRGVLVARGTDSVTVDVGGVGYQVFVTPRALADLPPIGDEVVLHTHLHVREDQLSLFGFPAEHERNVFHALLGASGVGPKMALSILATLDPAALRRAVAADDVAALEAVPGVGKRTAQKLILELRPRLDVPDGDLPAGGGAVAEARSALEELGFGQTEIREALSNPPEGATTEQLLAEALRALGRR